MKNIEILNNKFKRLCFMDNSVPDALHYYGDKLTTKITSGVYELEFKVDKHNAKAQHLVEGNYITFLNNQGVRLFMLIYGVDDVGGLEKTVYCEDAALILVNSFADPIEKPTAPQTIDYYLKPMLQDTGFSIGKNECTGKAIIGFEESDQSILARIREILKTYLMEFYMSVELTGEGPRFYINIVKHRLEGQPGFRLSSDDVVQHIERRVNIRNVITRLTVRGAEIKDDTKQTTGGTSTVPVPATQAVSTGVDGKIAKLIQWFKDREGKVRYSQDARTGPHSYDCSSAVYFALLFAGYIQPTSWPYTTETLYGLEGRLLQPISFADAKPGDIFVAGVKGASGGDYGHTGVYVGNGKIIHCNAADNGISTTAVQGRTGAPLHWYRLKG